ncbi:hypothetical protein SDC9_132154 [bioreactor metagenome]|uniref:Uncharacterized protein n=1 Tax=bioreactor metagenome TaxID=1076179 RepID=A0A645D7B4_9ZZZZ
MLRSPVLCQQPIAIPFEQGATEGAFLFQSAAEGVVAVGGVCNDGLTGVRGLDDPGALQLVLDIPAQLNDGVFADLLFDQVAVCVVGESFVFEDFEPIVLDKARSALFAAGIGRHHVVRRVEGEAFIEPRLCCAQQPAYLVVLILRCTVTQIVDALEISRQVVQIPAAQDGCTLHRVG